MKGWLIFKKSEEELTPDDYETNRFLEEAKKENVDLKVYKPEQFDIVVTKEDEKSILIDGKPEPLPDFVLPRMGSGTTYFALAVLRHLERLGIHIVNGPSSIDTVKDKLFTQQILAENNLPVPKTMLAKSPVNTDLVEKTLGFPVVVKTITGSLGSGVFLAENKNTFSDLIPLIYSTNPKANLILQEFIAKSHGTDLRVFTVGGKVVGCMQRKNANGGFKANFSIGAGVEEFPLTPEIEWLATQTARLLNLDISGIDLLFDNDHFKVCEANSSPFFKGIESCVNVNIPKEIFTYLKVRLGLFDAKPQTNKTKTAEEQK